MSLTTPVIRDEDHVFPGENWFFYWRTSASLWPSKIESLGSSRNLYVPINWSFHSDTGDSYDFAKDKPETDLARLVEVAKKCRKEVIFLFPLSPVPFLPNGGVPSFLARTPSFDKQGKVVSAIDHEGNLNKMYSFFDTRTYQAYSKFTQSFGHYMSSLGIEADVWGIECGYITDTGFTSLLEDYSPAYTQGFSKYLQDQRDRKRQESGSSFEDGVINFFEEYLYRQEFFEMIRSIYSDRAKGSLAANWIGEFRVSFMGASPLDFFQRINGQDSLSRYSHDILESLSLDAVPSSVLVPARIKRGVLGKMLDQLVTSSYVDQLVEETIYEDEASIGFRHKRFFEVFDLTNDVDPDSLGWADLGLWDYLQDRYAWCYSDRGSDIYQWNESDDNERVLFFHGITIDSKLFNHILKAFMSGSRIILNRSGLPVEMLRKLETFFIENDLDVQKVNFHTSIHYVTLGEGKLVIFEGDLLADLDESKVTLFWDKIISAFKVNHLNIETQKDVQTVWMARCVDHRELSYQEVRRVSLYNPSSYKRKIKFPVPAQFRLLKVVDENQVNFAHSPSDINMELLPEGSISLDFGVLP